MQRPIIILAALALLGAMPATSHAGGNYGGSKSSSSKCRHGYSKTHCSQPPKSNSSGSKCRHGYSKSHCQKPPSNRPPQPKDDCTVKVTAGKSITIDVLANDSDPDNDRLTIAGVSRPYHGSAVVRNNKVVYTPAKNYKGNDLFYYSVSDGKGHCSVAKVCLQVTKPTPPPNCPPKANDDCTITVEANGSKVINVLANDTDADGDKLTIIGVSRPYHGTASIQNNKILYTPSRNYVGDDLFYYTISDGKGHCDIAKVCLKVVKSGPPPNTPPKAKDDCDDNEVAAGDEITIDVLANDTDADSDDLTVINVTNPAHGTAIINGDGTITYKANAGYDGDDSFAYTISDGKGGKDTATVCLLVTVPLPPDRDCDGILLFGVDGYLTTEMAEYLVANGVPQDQVTVYRTKAQYEPNVLKDAIDYFKGLHNGKLPCTMMFDPEIIGPGGQWTGLGPADAQYLKNLILGGMGLVYAEPTDLGERGSQYPDTPFGQLPTVLPVTPYTDFDQFLVYDIVDPLSPLVNPTLPGLFDNPYSTGNLSFWPQSSGQAQGLALELGNPVPGVQYANVNVVLESSSSFLGEEYGTGYPTAYTLDYQPAGGPKPGQPGGRVAIIGTDPFPKGYGPDATVVSPTILALYHNALVYTSGG